MLGIAIQQALFGLAGAASFRREPVDTNVIDPKSLNNITASLSQERYAPWDVTCVRNTGRMCEAAMNMEKTVVDYMGQCDTMNNEHCSTGNNFPGGYCVCAPGFCADGAGKCQQKKSVIVDKSFSMYTEQHGKSKKLYMLPNGKVMLGTPQHPTQAQWRIVVLPDGLMNFFTNAYPNRLMDSYEKCIKFTETVKCQTLVGSTVQPPARGTGWKLDHSGVFDKNAEATVQEASEFLILRDYESSSNLYIHHLTNEALLCSPGDSNCPGPGGHIFFDPNIFLELEVKFTYPPNTAAEYVFQWVGMTFIIIIALCLCVMNARLDNHATHIDDTILTGPANFIRNIVTCSCFGHGVTHRK